MRNSKGLPYSRKYGDKQQGKPMTLSVGKEGVKLPHWLVRLRHRIFDGYDCCEVANLGHYLSKYMLPKMRVFVKNDYSHPASMTEKQWDKVCGEMLFALEEQARDWECPDDIDYKRMDKGFALIGKHWRDLWW